MSGLGLSGLASGMSTDDIIQKILNIENKKVLNQQMKKAQVEAKQEAWKQVRSSLQTLRSALDGVRLASTFSARSATLSDSTVASVTVGSGATTTTHSLSVSKLATYHVTATKDFADANETLSTGYAGGFPLDFTIKIDGEATGKTIQVETTDTLNSLKDKINGIADSGVKAEVVKVPVGADIRYRLVLTATTQGASGDMTIEDNQTNDFLKHIGLRNADNTQNELSVAQDAAFTLNGISYTSSTNTITDILPGVTINLKKSGDPVAVSTSITIDRDLDKTIASVEGWIKAYNDTLGLLKEATSYDADAKKKGLLNGEELARSIMSNLRDMISRTVTGLPSTMNQLSQAGITTGAYGTADYGKIVVDKTKLREALAEDDQAVAKLFGAVENNVALESAGASIDLAETNYQAGAIYDPKGVINGDSSSDRFGSAGGGWESPDPPSVTPQKLTINLSGTKSIESIRIYQPDNDTYQASTTGLKNFTVEYYGSDNDWHPIESVTNHAGPFKTLTFDPVNASKVRVTVSETYGDAPARISEIEVSERNDGAAASMYRYVNQTLFKSVDGALDTRADALQKQVSEVSKQIERLTDQMTKREAQLRQQFLRMEQTLAKLQNQSGFVSMIGQMTTSSSQKG